MTSVSVGAAIGASFRFLTVGWRRAWAVMLALVWLSAVLRAIQVERPEWVAVSFLGLIALLFVTTAATGALYRTELAADHGGDAAFAVGPAGLRWGSLEWRVLGANLVVGTIVFFALVVIIVIWAIVFGVSAAGQAADLQAVQAAQSDQDKMAAVIRLFSGPAGVISFVVLIPLLIGLSILAAKLALFAVTAADTGSFDFRRAWGFTRGALIALIATFGLIVLTQVAVGAGSGFLVGVIAGALGQDQHGGSLWGGVAGQAAGAAINAPLVAGLQLYVYRTRRGDPGVAQTFA